MPKILSAIFGALVFFFSSTSVVFALPQINEFLAHPASGLDEWVEIYNPDGVDLSGYSIDDITGGGRPPKSLSSLPSPTEKYVYVTFSSGYAYFNNEGDSVNLIPPGGSSPIDSYSYSGDPGIDVVIGRTPDGGGWTIGIISTPGGPNPGASTPTPTPSPTPTPVSTPTSSPTPTPTSTPKPSPTSSSTTSTTSKTPIPTPSPKPVGTGVKLTEGSKDSNTNLVLGVQESPVVEGTESGASTTEEGSNQGRKPFLAIGLIALGTVFLGIAGYAFLRERSSGRIRDLDEKTS